jgi:uncharacterized protein YndB with AHSA1/START domain
VTHGTYETLDGRPALVFERRLAHPIDTVWAAVTDPAELAGWFPARVAWDGDLRPGAALTFTFAGDAIPPSTGEVLEVDAPRLFAFAWGDDLLRIELREAGGECVLRFTHIFDERDAAARDAAGWHVCLDRLEERVAGRPTEAPGTEQTDEHRARYEEYVERGLPSGAPMPG